MQNPDLATGDVEVVAQTLEVLNPSETPPFPIEDRIEAGEDLRLRYRYLDLRRPEMTKVLAMRASIVRTDARAHGRARLRRGRDAHAHALDARGVAGLPRAEPAVAGHVLRAARSRRSS